MVFSLSPPILLNAHIGKSVKRVGKQQCLGGHLHLISAAFLWVLGTLTPTSAQALGPPKGATEHLLRITKYTFAVGYPTVPQN
eukprot:6139138-Amphidinium_carterae.1